MEYITLSKIIQTYKDRCQGRGTVQAEECLPCVHEDLESQHTREEPSVIAWTCNLSSGNMGPSLELTQTA